MQISKNGISMIQEFEGLRLQSYVDAVGVWTIGYGHTKDVKPRQLISKPQAVDLLRQDLAESQNAVNRLTHVELTQNEFDALASFVFNVGIGAFTNSTLLKLLNAKDYTGASEQFLRWDHGSGNEVLPGLLNRRSREKALFESKK